MRRYRTFRKRWRHFWGLCPEGGKHIWKKVELSGDYWWECEKCEEAK